jgi:HSP20 family molecular chaperone IbpA
MECSYCGYDVEDEWKFCPRCGSRLKKGMFSDIFSRVEREMKEMDKLFERNLEFRDLSPWFKQIPKGRGFSIKITQTSGEKPKVSIRTFGDMKIKDVEKEIGKLGLKELKHKEGTKLGKGIKEIVRKPKVTEEPKTEIRRVGDKIVVEMDLPGVGSEKDIEIKTLENSIEVKALAGDKAYFKILTKPPHSNITNHRLAEGKLHLEIS